MIVRYSTKHAEGAPEKVLDNDLKEGEVVIYDYHELYACIKGVDRKLFVRSPDNSYESYLEDFEIGFLPKNIRTARKSVITFTQDTI